MQYFDQFKQKFPHWVRALTGRRFLFPIKESELANLIEIVFSSGKDAAYREILKTYYGISLEQTCPDCFSQPGQICVGWKIINGVKEKMTEEACKYGAFR